MVEVDYLNRTTCEAVNRFRSVGKAIRRDPSSPYGVVYPKKPYGNTNIKENIIKE